MKKINEGNQRKAGAILSYVSIIANTIVGLVYSPYLIRILGQSEYGLYSLISSVIGYLTVLDFGFGNAVIVYTARYRAKGEYDKEKKLHGMFFLVFCIIAIITVALGIVLYFLLPIFFGKTMTPVELKEAKVLVIIMIINLAFNFVFSIYSSILSAYEEFIYQKIMNIVSIILKPIIMIPLLSMGCKSIGMASVLTGINIFIMISNYLYCRKKLDIKIRFYGFDNILFKEIFRYSFWIFLNIIVDKINWSVDKFILGAVSGTIAVSVYSVAARINDMVVNLSTAVSGVLLPKMTKMVAKDADSNQVTNEFIKVGRIQYYIIFLIVSGFALFGKEFINAWVGEQYEDAYYITLILIVTTAIPLIQNLGISILQAMNKHKFRSVVYFFVALANVIISIPLAKKYGGIGSAIGTAIGVTIGNIIIMNIYYQKSAKINVIKFWKQILKMTITFIIPIAIILIINHLKPLYGYRQVLVYGGIYTILYSITCYFIDMNDYEKNIVNKVLIKIHLKKLVER